MLINPNTVTRWIIEHFDLWQMDFMNPDRLHSFVQERSNKFWAVHITQLWQIGWLRADFISSKRELEIDHINFIAAEGKERFYSDDRILGVSHSNAEEVVRALDELPEEMVLNFHPFKYFVLNEVQRVIGIHINPYQMFFQSRYQSVLEKEIQEFNQWVDGGEIPALINRWNNIATLAIAAEPCYFPEIFGTYRRAPNISIDRHWEDLQNYRGLLRDDFMQLGIDAIKGILSDLSTSAEMLDPNKKIHTLLRFMDGRSRLNVTGALGGALLLKSMAEIIRRMTEWVYKEQLPEEDELGFGITIQGAKEKIYGARRIFDSSSFVARQQIIRGLGLDSEIRIRFYVEGDTEYYAIKYLLSGIPQIEIINLAGQFYQSRGKGLAFRESLILDDSAQVFSIICLDGDRGENVRVVRVAANEDIFCGIFLIFDPDFESANFSRAELEEIILILIEPTEYTKDIKRWVHNTVHDYNRNNWGEILTEVKRLIPSLSHLNKGKDWGEKLAQFGLSRNYFSSPLTLRPFIEAANYAVTNIGSDFLLTRKTYRTDPNTGRLVKREL